MRKSGVNVLVLGLVSLAASSCAAILGLDQFSEGKGTGGAGGTGGSGGGPDLCGDSKKDGAETGKDCGGPCSPCPDGEGCAVGPDCASKICATGTCIAPSCFDKIKNGAEADVDCGGACPKCGPAQSCGGDGDCVSGKCTAGACVSTCTDGLKGGAETDVDCGGGAVSTCPGCASNGACKVGGDCASGVCRVEKCVDTAVWAKHFAAPQGMAVFPNSVQAGTLSVDKSNNILVSASVYAAADFGAGPTGGAGKGGDYLTKYDPTGALLWSLLVGNTYPGTASASGFQGDAAGNTVVTGEFTGSVFFGNITLTSVGATDLFIAKLDASGKTLWAQSFGDAKSQQASSLQLDAQGNIVVCGLFQGTLALGGAPLVSAGGTDIYVAQFAPDGKHLWSKRFGSPSDEIGVAALLDKDGNVILSVALQGSIDFGGGPLSTASFDYDVAIVKLDPSGNHLWSQRFGGPGDEYGNVAVDGTGNVVLSMVNDNSGNGPVPVDLGGGPLVKIGLLAKFDPAGGYLWSDGFDAYGSVIADTSGNLVMTGACLGNLDFGSGALVCPGQSADVFVAKFDAAGKSTWSRRFGDVQNDQHGVAVRILEGTGDIALLGQFHGMLDFGGGPIPSTTTQDDVFLARLRLP